MNIWTILDLFVLSLKSFQNSNYFVWLIKKYILNFSKLISKQYEIVFHQILKVDKEKDVKLISWLLLSFRKYFQIHLDFNLEDSASPLICNYQVK